jgi:hypothetical protein
MSTIHQPVHHHHTGLYLTAAAIVLAGLLAALVVAVFWPSHASDGTPPAQNIDQSSVRPYHGPPFREVCFAHRSGQSVELAQSGCTTP